jgi:hypothetical protein
MDTKAPVRPWRWFAIGSLLWIVAAYLLLTAQLAPKVQSLVETGQSQCSSVERYDSYAFAQCVQSAAQDIETQKVGITQIISLVAFGPVVALWFAIFVIGFINACRLSKRVNVAPGQFYKNAQRRRWSADRPVMVHPDQ